VRAYHGVLQAKKITPKLSLEKDLELTEQSMGYEANEGQRTTIAGNPLVNVKPVAAEATTSAATLAAKPLSWPVHPNGAPDFDRMDPAQRRAYDQHRLTRKFG